MIYCLLHYQDLFLSSNTNFFCIPVQKHKIEWNLIYLVPKLQNKTLDKDGYFHSLLSSCRYLKRARRLYTKMTVLKKLLFLQNLPHILKKVRPHRLDERKSQVLLHHLRPLSHGFYKCGLLYFFNAVFLKYIQGLPSQKASLCLQLRRTHINDLNVSLLCKILNQNFFGP